MSSLTDELNSITNGSSSSDTVAASKFIFDTNSRKITVPDEYKSIGVFQDNNARTVCFEVDRYYDGVDLADKTAMVQYINASELGDYCTIEEKEVTDDKIYLSWSISDYLTSKEGDIQFSVRFYEEDENGNNLYCLNSMIATLTVLPGLNVIEEVAERYPGMVTEMLKRITTLEKNSSIGNVSLDSLSYSNSDLGATNAKSALDEIVSQLSELSETVNYIEPKITSFTLSPSTTTYEMGKVIPTLTLNWEFNKDISSQTLSDVNSLDSAVRSYSYSNIGATKTFLLTASDGKNTVSGTKTVTFLNKKYYGSATAPSNYDSNFILGLTGVLSSSRTGNFNTTCGSDQYIFFCIPTTFGTASFNVNGFAGGFELTDTIDFTNSSGYTTQYAIYKSNNKNLGAITVTVS